MPTFIKYIPNTHAFIICSDIIFYPATHLIWKIRDSSLMRGLKIDQNFFSLMEIGFLVLWDLSGRQILMRG
jgi:hypothetical protein